MYDGDHPAASVQCFSDILPTLLLLCVRRMNMAGITTMPGHTYFFVPASQPFRHAFITGIVLENFRFFTQPFNTRRRKKGTFPEFFFCFKS